MAYTATHMMRLSDGKSLAARIKDITKAITVHDAASHNSQYYMEKIGNVVTDEQWQAIGDGTFKGLYPGCYWRITFPAYSWEDENGATHNEASATMNFRIAGCDTRLGTGSYNLQTHHLEIVPAEALFDAPMNLTNTTEGGYLGSKMVTNYLRRAEALIKAAFSDGDGGDHILPYREYYHNAVTDGRSSGGVWATRCVDLMTEQMVYGSKIYGVASDGGSTVPVLATTCKTQLPFFRYRPERISNRISFWLRDIVNDKAFANVQENGLSYSRNASVTLGVRPSFLIY